MKAIKTSHPISKELFEQGFSVINAEKLHFSSEMEQPKDIFLKDWDNLVLDDFMMDGETYRQRRYGRFSFNSNTMKLNFQGKVKYFQSKDYNPLLGGQDRQFAPITNETVENEFLRELILFDFNQLPVKEEDGIENWNVGVHQIRICSEPGSQGSPAPEGIHKDGEKFTIQHLVKRENITGGINAVYDNNKKLIAEWTQNEVFDSYYFEDDVIYHSVTPIESKDRSNDGYRDVLLIDFDPIRITKT